VREISDFLIFYIISQKQKKWVKYWRIILYFYIFHQKIFFLQHWNLGFFFWATSKRLKPEGNIKGTHFFFFVLMKNWKLKGAVDGGRAVWIETTLSFTAAHPSPLFHLSQLLLLLLHSFIFTLQLGFFIHLFLLFHFSPVSFQCLLILHRFIIDQFFF
jgi:hypothetical protein